MVKRVPARRRLRRPSSRRHVLTVMPAQSRLFLTTAVEAVVRAGDMMMARFGGDVRVDKKGAIDLVTEVDVAIERMFRELIAERFPDHAVLGEELGGSAHRAGRARAGSSIRSTARRTSRTACRSSARRWRSRSTASPRSAAVYDPTRRSCSRPSAAAARS